LILAVLLEILIISSTIWVYGFFSFASVFFFSLGPCFG
jgi:hypothetical protein